MVLDPGTDGVLPGGPTLGGLVDGPLDTNGEEGPPLIGPGDGESNGDGDGLTGSEDGISETGSLPGDITSGLRGEVGVGEAGLARLAETVSEGLIEAGAADSAAPAGLAEAIGATDAPGAVELTPGDGEVGAGLSAPDSAKSTSSTRGASRSPARACSSSVRARVATSSPKDSTNR